MQEFFQRKKELVAFFTMVFCFTLWISAAYAESAPSALEELLLSITGQEMTVQKETLLDGVSEVYGAEDGAIAAITAARGFESEVKLLVGIGADGTVTGIYVIAQNETPERGGQVLAEPYLSQFIGRDSAEGVDAFSGATGTSNAVFACVETAIRQYKEINGIAYEAERSAEEILAEAVETFLGAEAKKLETEPVKLVEAVYQSKNGYAVVVEKPGFDEAAPIRLLVCLDTEGAVKKIVVLEQHETLDNGSQALGENYLALYEGGKQFTVFDGLPGTKIDTLAGATESSYSVFQLVNAATMQYSRLTGAGMNLLVMF